MKFCFSNRSNFATLPNKLLLLNKPTEKSPTELNLGNEVPFPFPHDPPGARYHKESFQHLHCNVGKSHLVETILKNSAHFGCFLRDTSLLGQELPGDYGNPNINVLTNFS